MMRGKIEIIIGFAILIIIGLVIGFVFSGYSPLSEPVREEGPSVEEVIVPLNGTQFVPPGSSICEGCHISEKSYIPQAYQLEQHADGGMYCLTCHIIDHNIHPINEEVTCERCHGITSPFIPEFRNGSIVCDQCHNFPDALAPSNGNLIVIHRPRNVDCMRCHTDSCLKCHDERKTNEKWQKRIAHFSALLQPVRTG